MINRFKRFLGIYSDKEKEINKISYELVVELSKYITKFLKFPPKKLINIFMEVQELILIPEKGIMDKSMIRYLQENLREISYKQIFIKDSDITHNQAEIILLVQILDEFCDSLDDLTFLIEDEIKILFMEKHNEYQSIRKEMKKIVDDTIAEIRLMSNALMPAAIDDFGIGVTLTNFIENIKKSTTVTIVYEDLTKQENSNITNHQAINLFRISQELINNSLKHSNAKNIRITLSEFDEFISLFYFDDGIGFDVTTIKLGLGISNIKERVAICNGKVTINAAAGNTTFEIELPIES